MEVLERSLLVTDSLAEALLAKYRYITKRVKQLNLGTKRTNFYKTEWQFTAKVPDRDLVWEKPFTVLLNRHGQCNTKTGELTSLGREQTMYFDWAVPCCIPRQK